AVLSWARYNQLDFIRCACRFTELCATPEEENTSKRQEVKLLIRELRKTNPNIDQNIFHAIHAVHLDTFPGYKSDGDMHSFLEKYNEEEEL
ncbi:MAG: tRNA 2-thiocytidine biosynthesis protein TtcA, partial [Oscillospiraceae bacterium]|nr:tRNA 2-thiocytidine biosynthesis protein TtcA [Oscillospiraceae bacterium]